MKKKMLLAAILIIVITALTVPAQATAPSCLFLTSETENAIDDTLIKRIESLGFDVVVKTDTAFDAAADSAGKAFVFVSESVTSGNIVDKFNGVAVPVIAGEAYFFDDMNLTGPTADTDFGSNTVSPKGHVVKPDHPIMKGVSTDYVAVTTMDLDPVPNYTWGVVPEKNALAVDPDNPTHAVVFAYEKGEMSAEGLFPAYAFPEKRVAINFHTSMAISAVSADMWKIFDNAVIWAAGFDPLAPPETEAPVTAAPGSTAQGTADTAASPKTADIASAAVLAALAGAIGVYVMKKKAR